MSVPTPDRQEPRRNEKEVPPIEEDIARFISEGGDSATYATGYKGTADKLEDKGNRARVKPRPSKRVPHPH
jgi:hypothetical protein